MAATVIVQVPRMIPELMRQQLFETAFLSDASGIRYGWIFDAIRRKPFGRVMLWLGGLYLTFPHSLWDSSEEFFYSSDCGAV